MWRTTYLGEGESAACSFVVFIGALKLKVLPPNSPKHSSQLLLQLQFPAGKKKGKTPGGGVNKNQESQAKWVWIAAEARPFHCFSAANANFWTPVLFTRRCQPFSSSRSRVRRNECTMLHSIDHTRPADCFVNTDLHQWEIFRCCLAIHRLYAATYVF